MPTTHHRKDCPGRCGRRIVNAMIACRPCWLELPVELHVAIQGADSATAYRRAVTAILAWYRQRNAEAAMTPNHPGRTRTKGAAMSYFGNTSHPKCAPDTGHQCQKPSGRTCCEADCDEPAGTLWGPMWCPDHDAERIDRVSAGFAAIAAHMTDPTPAAPYGETGETL